MDLSAQTHGSIKNGKSHLALGELRSEGGNAHVSLVVGKFPKTMPPRPSIASIYVSAALPSTHLNLVMDVLQHCRRIHGASAAKVRARVRRVKARPVDRRQRRRTTTAAGLCRWLRAGQSPAVGAGLRTHLQAKRTAQGWVGEV